MSTIDIGGFAETLIKNGAPLLAQVLTTLMPPPFGGLASIALTTLGTALGVPPTIGAVQGAIVADPTGATAALQQAEAQITAEMELLKKQVDLNEEEGKSTSWFISAWRPTFAWSVMFWMNYNFIAYLAGFKGLSPELFNPAWMVFGGMMGLRTVEKWAGVARSTLSEAEGVISHLQGTAKRIREGKS